MDHVKDIVDRIAGPTVLFFGAVAAVSSLILLRGIWTRPRVAAGIALVLIAFSILGLADPVLASNAAKPDNAAIAVLLVLLGFCLWMGFRRMAINDRSSARGLPTLEARESLKQVFSWPDLIYVEFLAILLVSILIVLWSILSKAPLEEPASLSRTPNPAKAPWYFLGLQEMLVYFDPPWAGVLFPSLIVFGLAALPYLDRNPRGNGYYTFKERPFAIGVFLFGLLVLWLFPILLGTFFRGPNWSFFGPFERFTDQKVEPLANINLSEYFYYHLLGTALPRSILLRELPGILLLSVYFLALPVILARTLLRGIRRDLGLLRYSVLALLLLFMASLPLKMSLRWLFNLKYLVAIPEKFFNL